MSKINEQHGPLPQHTIICTMDVTSLYSNIPTDELITAAQHYLAHQHSASEVNILTKFMDLVLTQNNFELAGDHYIQIHGTAMGTRMAPSGACPFMGCLEEDLLLSSTHKSLIWLRYIDDIFLIWTHGQQELDNFITLANIRHPDILLSSSHLNSLMTPSPFLMSWSPFLMVTWKVTCTPSLPTPTNTSNGHLAILNIRSTAFHIAWPSDADVYVPLRKLYPPELPNSNTIS